MSKNLFTILPMSQQISLSAGETYTGTITIANPSNATEDFHYLVEVTPYSVIGQDYQADLSTKNIYTALSDWITLNHTTGTIPPNGRVDINYTITVPADTPGGGQYAAILVSSDPEYQSSQEISVNNTYQLASLIYADVSGETIHDSEVISNDFPNFILSDTISTEALIANHGNIHEQIYISHSVTNSITGEPILIADPDSDYAKAEYAEIIMPDTTRYLSREINNLPPLGIFKVNQTIYLNDIAYTTEHDVILCPLWFLSLVIFTIISLIITIFFRIRHHRRNKNPII